MLSSLVSKISAGKLRIEHNQQVHILAHRINTIAQRNCLRDKSKQRLLATRLQAEEEKSVQYWSVFTWHTKWTGMLYIIDNYGNRLAVHHTDVVRA